MLNLEPLIARLVDDVLRAIGTLTLEDLRDLAAPSTMAARAKRPLPRRKVTRSRSKGASDSDGAAPGAVMELPAEGDITEPERLLATARPHVLTDEDRGRADREEEPPSSSVRPVVGFVVSLRPGERLASAPGAGVVIRRAKKA
jgi:hypothetical protein